MPINHPSFGKLDADRVIIFDTTLRDGEQSPGCSMNTDEKLAFAHQLERLGVDIIEGGFPIASRGDFEAVQRISAEVRGPRISALARCVRGDIDTAHQALKEAARPRIHTFLATSDIHLGFKLKMSRQDALRTARECVAYARTLCDDIEFSPEDATRSDPDFLCEVLQAVVDSGATTLNIPDTVGYTMPEEYGRLIRKIRETVKGDNLVISSPTHWPASLTASVRSSAPSTESASAPVTARSKKLSWVSTSATTSTPSSPVLIAPSSTPPARCSPRFSASTCSPTRQSSAATPSLTKREFTSTVCSATRSATRS
jgi:hypothetical protein